MIEYSVESGPDVIEELKGYIYEHASETDIYQEHFKLDPDFDVYYAMEKAGALKIFTARENEKIVGYLVFFVGNNPHYKDKVYATNDLLYVIPSKRGSGIIKNLFSYAEKSLLESGVHVITFNMKSHLDLVELARKMGYDKAEIMYTKYIGNK